MEFGSTTCAAENKIKRHGLLQSHLWCPKTLKDYDIEYNRIQTPDTARP